MKGVIVLGTILVVLAAGVWWFIMRETMADQGQWIPLAFGNAGDSSIEMHIAVEMMTTVRDHPRVNERGEPLWDEWISQHFDLRDAANAPVEFTRIGWSPFINEDRNKVLAECYVKCDLQKGGQYTLDVIRKAAQQQKYRYRHTFSAPSEPQDMQRVCFKLVTK